MVAVTLIPRAEYLGVHVGISNSKPKIWIKIKQRKKHFDALRQKIPKIMFIEATMFAWQLIHNCPTGSAYTLFKPIEEGYLYQKSARGRDLLYDRTGLGPALQLRH